MEIEGLIIGIAAVVGDRLYLFGGYILKPEHMNPHNNSAYTKGAGVPSKLVIYFKKRHLIS